MMNSMTKKIAILILLFVGSSLLAQASERPKYASSSVLSSGNWYKVGMSASGIYKLTYSDLSSLGMDVDHLNPQNLRVYHNG